MAGRDADWMRWALDLARQGRGLVEPNPMVGCVIVEEEELISSGYHRRFGGAHAEVDAIEQCDLSRIANSTVYVTLEPCSHFGKTPPCVDLLLRHRPKRVVVAMPDPYPEVSGRGIAALRASGIEVEVGLLADQAKALNAPYLKLLATGLPWTIAKWAMTLDGALATHKHDSKWISNEESRSVVHQIRSRVDAVIVGIGTVLADDPLLTTRLPTGITTARVATRVIVDRNCRVPLSSQLVQTAHSVPVVIATSEKADAGRVRDLIDAGCEILPIAESMLSQSLPYVLRELGKRRFTNVLLEGGGTLLGHAFDCSLVDQVHCFIAPKIAGGENAVRPVGGTGKLLMREAQSLDQVSMQQLGDNVHLQGMVHEPLGASPGFL